MGWWSVRGAKGLTDAGTSHLMTPAKVKVCCLMLGAASAFIISKTLGVTLRFLGPATRLLSSFCHILSSLKRISGAVDADSLRIREAARAAVM